MGTSEVTPLSHGGISPEAAVATYGDAALGPVAPPEPEGGDGAADPWDNMTTHSQIDGFVAGRGIIRPEGWSSKTIAQKKGWLDDNG